MSKLEVGDTVVYHGHASTKLQNGSAYTVATPFGQTCSLVGITGSYPTHLFSKVTEVQVQEQSVLTPQEVFTAILEGVPLEYRITVRGVACRWYTLTNPERINLADVKYSEFRKQVQTVTLSGTVPKPVPYDSIEVTDKVYTVYISNMNVSEVNGRYAQIGGLYWRTQEEAEQFRDALTECFSTVPVLD